MPKVIEDEELRGYQQLIGRTEYSRQYVQLYQEARQKKTRYSGKQYTNTKEHLQALKDKYKNGVPAGTIKAMIDGLM